MSDILDQILATKRQEIAQGKQVLSEVQWLAKAARLACGDHAVAVTAAAAIGIPVTGIDLLVPDVTSPDYVFIEANERPGLANHEPQPTAKAFVDFLFPNPPGLPQAWTPDEAARTRDQQR